MPDTQSEVDVYEDIVYGATSTREFIIEAESGQLVFDLQPVDRAVRNRVQSTLPENMLDEVADSDTTLEDLEDGNVSLDDLGDVNLAAMQFTEEATEAWTDMLVEGLHHDQLSETEIRKLVESANFPDKAFYDAGGELLDISVQSGEVEGFRVSE